MLFHASAAVDDPRHVAEVFAELWDGEALPFPPLGVGSWAAFAGDDRNTLMEFYARGNVLYETPGDEDAHCETVDLPRHGASHFALATSKSVDEVLAIARREGWPAKYRKRGDEFGVIEMWVEGCLMVEWLTPEMQREYLDTQTLAHWREMTAEMAA